MEKPVWSHEDSYKYRGITGIIHRKRLNKILGIFSEIDIKNSGKLADFGCSSGYIISLLQEGIFTNGKRWNFYGFDCEDKLLSLARSRKLKNTEFNRINLNEINNGIQQEGFDITTCFETIEHIGNYKNAFLNIYNSCKLNGIIIISIPNEKKLPGLIKYLGRKLLRPNAYGTFFKGQSEFKYLTHLILNKSIGGFRRVNLNCWGEHLGFDWSAFEQFIDEGFLKNGRCRLLNKHSSFLRFNFIYTLEKLR